MNASDRIAFAVAFAERIVDIGGSARTAIRVASAQYEIEPEVLLTEWCRRLMAKVLAAEAIAKART